MTSQDSILSPHDTNYMKISMEGPRNNTKELLKKWIEDDEKDLENVRRIRDNAKTEQLREAMDKEVKAVEDAIRRNKEALDKMK